MTISTPSVSMDAKRTSRFSLAPFSSDSRRSTLVSFQAVNYSRKHVRVHKSQGMAGELSNLFDPQYRLRAAIPIRVQWEGPTGEFVAFDDIFNWHGIGATPAEAILHLTQVILEDFQDLQEWEPSLAPDLQQKLNLMREYITHADQE
jgi:hypothetical protein